MWIRDESRYESMINSPVTVLEDSVVMTKEALTSPSIVIPPPPATTTTTKVQQIESAIRTKDIWLLRSLALSPNGFIHDTYRQQAWPLLLREQPNLPSPPPQPIHSMIPTPAQKQPPPPSPPISPCSVIPNTITSFPYGNTIDDNDNDDDETIQYQSKNHLKNNNDATIMWYDVQRYHPSTTTSTTTNTHYPSTQPQSQYVEDFRCLLLHVMEESLSLSSSSPEQQPQWRYYQGYHIIAGLILSTFLHTTTTTTVTTKHTDMIHSSHPPLTYDEMYMISYATTDTIQLLQQLIRTIPFIYDMVVPDCSPNTDTGTDDSLQRIVQQIRHYVIPLYYYYYYNNNNSHGQYPNHEDIDHFDDMEQYMIGKCMTWILTLFGTGHHHNPSSSYNNNNDNNKSSLQYSNVGQRYMDVLLASHPYYFIFYLCVSKLIVLMNPNSKYHQVSSSFSDNDDDNECEIVIHQAIRMMEEIPPHTLPKVFSWYYQDQSKLLQQSETPSNCDTASFYKYYENEDHRGDRTSIINNMNNIDHCCTTDASSSLIIAISIKTMIRDLYRSYVYHDVIIATASYYEWNRHRSYYMTIRCGIRYMINGYKTLWKPQSINFLVFVLLRSLRRLVRRQLRKCRTTLIKHRFWWWYCIRHIVIIIIFIGSTMTWMCYRGIVVITSSVKSHREKKSSTPTINNVE